MNTYRIVSWAVIVGMFALLSGCSVDHKSGPKKDKTASSSNVEAVEPSAEGAQAFEPFYVYRDKGFKNRFTPSGYMPDGQCINLDDGWQYDPKEGKTCIRIIYDIACSKEGRKWAGIYWQNPPDNWGSKKGGYNLAGATKLVFWARGELGGERIEEFRVGGMGGDEMYPDTDMAFIGPVILTNEWKKYTIDLRGKDLSYISGGFAWTTSSDVNPHHCTFYLDDIHYE